MPETVLITGASGGIGAELARLFARDGYNLILVARSREKLAEIAEELKKPHIPSELRSKPAVEALLADIRAKGYAATNGQHKVPGIEGVAAPVFNFKNEITMSLLVVGVQGMVDISPESAVVASLKRSAEALSLRLGAHGEPKIPA